MNISTDNINYLKITYRDRWNTQHIIKATLKDVTQHDIKACVKTEEKLFIDCPQEVELSIVTDEGLYKTKTTLKYTEFVDPYLFFIMDRNDDLSFKQEREYFRVKYKDGVVINFKVEDEIKRIVCKTVDISAKGVKVELPYNYKIPQDVNLKLYVKNNEMLVNAKLIRNNVEDDIPTASFQFVNIKEQDMDFISKFCLQKQIEDKRKNM